MEKISCPIKCFWLAPAKDVKMPRIMWVGHLTQELSSEIGASVHFSNGARWGGGVLMYPNETYLQSPSTG